MNVRKVAVTVPGDLVDRANSEVDQGRAKSLSAFLTEAVREKLERDDLKKILEQLDRELGPPSRKDRGWAKKVVARAVSSNRPTRER